MGGITFKFKEILKIRHKLIADKAIQIRRNGHRRNLPHAGQTMMIAAGETAEDLLGQAEAGGLDHVDQRTGGEQVIGETLRLIVPDILRAGAVMAQDNVTELTGQRTLDKDLGKLLIISHNIMRFPFLFVHRGKSVLIRLAEHADHAPAIMIDVVRQFLKRDDQDAGKALQDRKRGNGRGVDSVLDEGFGGFGGGALIVRRHDHDSPFQNNLHI